MANPDFERLRRALQLESGSYTETLRRLSLVVLADNMTGREV